MKTCGKHPKYKGKKEPANECVACLEVYLERPRHRAPILPSKRMKDKSKYNRKQKHTPTSDVGSFFLRNLSAL